MSERRYVGLLTVVKVEIFDKSVDVPFCVVEKPLATEISLVAGLCELWDACVLLDTEKRE
jgi:hypothetical protein